MGFARRIYELQTRADETLKKIGKGKYGRVIKLARKPTSEEYKKVLQITSAGILIIGGVGFLIYFLWNNLYGFLLWLLDL
jgi:protein transport protein SEC61 subunit gamma-like protein